MEGGFVNVSKVHVARRAVSLALAVGALLAATLVPALPASATVHAAPPGNYLALGDSVAFGYIPPQAVPPPNYSDPSSFIGYPEDLGRALGLHVVNASCPGETTASMIAVGAQSNGCENSVGSPVGYRTVFPLHVKYSGTQLAFAVHYLAHHSTQLVTINIGANDAFVCEETTQDNCTSELPALLAQIRQNLKTIYVELRDVGHYRGPIVALTYYSLDYSSPLVNAESQVLNSAIIAATKAFGGIIANGYGAFRLASQKFGGDPCAAGLLVKLPGGSCNIHPSPAGHLVLAAAIAQALGR
jgi:lysophospholipase L1-like esterase